MKKSWFSINNKTDAEAEVCIYDEIGMWGISAKDFLTELKGVGNRRIVLRINSPGGEVFDGLAIFNRLSEHAPGVEVRIDGIAASMASVIAMVGSPIKMAENALMMIHDPNGICMGDAGDMRDLADMLDKVKGCLVGAYTKKTGKSAEDIAAMMAEETWLNATEAKEQGFIDETTDSLKIAANFDRLKMTGKLEERQNEIDATPNNDKSVQMNTAEATPPTAAEIELQAINAKKVAEAAAAEVKRIRDEATTTERQRVTDIRAWAGEVSKVQNIDLSEATDKFVADGKTLSEFKDHVITTAFKAKKLETPTDTSSAEGNTMKREAFEKLTPFNKSDFCKKGGTIVD